MKKFLSLPFKIHCSIAFVVRLLLVAYSNFHDKHFDVRYTDIDYRVFTDAARLVTQGKSPYERHTYRYTPLLALLLTPNVIIHEDWGKILFCVVDILVGYLIHEFLSKENCSRNSRVLSSLLWLYNPLTIVISTRGNADSLAALLVISALYFLRNDRCILAGILHGLAIHLRLYPIAFSLSMYLSLREKGFLSLPNRKQVLLVISCLVALFGVTSVSYYFYGYRFLYESLIYHLTRKDARHNFSVYFYMLYLSTGNHPPSALQRILTFLPQLVVLIILSFVFSSKRRLSFGILTQAMVIVIYNPVMTSQYFFWFLSILPLCLHNLGLSRRRSICLLIAWVSSQVFWLYFAYLLEFQGINTFLYIWLSSLLFFAVNLTILVDFVKYHSISDNSKHD